MAARSDAPGRAAAARPSLTETVAVYLKPRVLVIMFLGFSSGLPLALSGSTLLVWMTEAGVNLGTIGLFALVGTPYTIKFLWAPLDRRARRAADVAPVRSPSRLAAAVAILLMAAIVFLWPVRSVGIAVAGGASARC